MDEMWGVVTAGKCKCVYVRNVVGMFSSHVNANADGLVTRENSILHWDGL